MANDGMRADADESSVDELSGIDARVRHSEGFPSSLRGYLEVIIDQKTLDLGSMSTSNSTRDGKAVWSSIRRDI
jgi:hypothetical protein